jgi:Leucine-rich repeat (LRR) protein
MPSDSAFDIISLELDYNNISDISALSGLTHLEYLYLFSNNISDISALSGLPYLGWLRLGSNPLSPEAINIHIPQLEARGVYLYGY